MTLHGNDGQVLRARHSEYEESDAMAAVVILAVAAAAVAAVSRERAVDNPSVYDAG